MNAPLGANVDIVAIYHGIQVPAAPHLGPGMIASMAAGRYERNEVELGLAAIPEGACVLELGAGSGVVGAVLARNCRPERMLSVEANPNLLPHARNLYAQNGLTDVISLRHGVVLTGPDAPETMTFYVRGNFLGSGLIDRASGRSTAVQVPVLRYDALKTEFPHDTIMMDIEGGELDFLRDADLSGVNLFIAEFHREIYGREGMQECRALLNAAGLTEDETVGGVGPRPGVKVYRRGAE